MSHQINWISKLEIFLLYFFAIACATSNGLMNTAGGIIMVCTIPFALYLGQKKMLFQYSKSLRIFWYLVLVFFLISFLSLLFSQIRGIVPDINFIRDLRKFKIFLCLFCLGFLFYKHQNHVRPCFRLWIFLLVVAAVYSVFQHYSGIDFFRPHNRGVLATSFNPKLFHGAGFYNHYLSYASIALLSVPMVFPFFQRKYAILLSVILALGVAFSFSRSAWVALGIQVLCLAFYFLKNPKKRIAFVLVFVLVVLGLAFVKPVKRRFVHFSNVPRVNLWKANLNMTKEYPLLGVGFRKNEYLSEKYVKQINHQENVLVGHAHNNFIEVLSSTGILGFLSFLSWWVLIFAKSLRQPKMSTFSFILVALVGFHILGMTQVNFFDSEASFNLVLVLAFWIFRMVQDQNGMQDA